MNKLQVVYCKDSLPTIDNYIVVKKLDKLYEMLEFQQLDFLGIPGDEEGADIIDFLISNDIKVKNIYIWGAATLSKLKLFFSLAKNYEEKGFKGNITMKHEYLDKKFKKIKKDLSDSRIVK